MQLDNLATQAARSVIVPMEGAIAEMGFTAQDFPQTLVEATEFNGHVWGVPLDSHTIASYANTDRAGQGRGGQAGLHRKGFRVRSWRLFRRQASTRRSGCRTGGPPT